MGVVLKTTVFTDLCGFSFFHYRPYMPPVGDGLLPYMPDGGAPGVVTM